MVGRYEVIKHLASGGMAQVLLARTTGLEGFQRHVVLKQIHLERAKDPQIIKMFLDEARLAASLHHTNIVQVHDVGQDGGEYFIAMEYIHGEDLRRLLAKLSKQRAQMPIEHVIAIVTQAAAALHHAHDQRGPDRKPLGLVHRDVSPANILVGYDGIVKVVDFGIAKAAHRSTETHSGTLKGKISYMAPEQCLGQEVDRRSDVFALGIVLYELFTIRRLFKAQSDFLTMSTIVSGQIPPPSRHRRDIPPELEQIILKALERNADDRFQTADEMRLALETLAGRLNLRGSPAGLADYMAAQFGRRPEPWLADEEPPPLEDFDASNGVAALSDPAVGDTGGAPTVPESPGSPFAIARKKSVTSKQRLPSAFGDDEVADNAPTTASGTPMAWQTPMPPPRRTKRRWPIVAAGGLFAGGVAIAFAVGTTGDAGPSPSAAAAPPAAIRAAAPPTVAPIAAPVAAPVAAPPAVDAEPPKPPVAVDAEPPKPPVAKKTEPKRVKPKPKPTDTKWDPDALFLKDPTK